MTINGKKLWFNLSHWCFFEKNQKKWLKLQKMRRFTILMGSSRHKMMYQVWSSKLTYSWQLEIIGMLVYSSNLLYVGQQLSNIEWCLLKVYWYHMAESHRKLQKWGAHDDFTIICFATKKAGMSSKLLSSMGAVVRGDGMISEYKYYKLPSGKLT